jgi:hypothetical protein
MLIRKENGDPGKDSFQGQNKLLNRIENFLIFYFREEAADFGEVPSEPESTRKEAYPLRIASSF